MEFILNQRQMQALDKYSMDQMGISGLFLMEQAARSVAEQIMKQFAKHSSVLIVVESGNNGGDGIALARLLHEADYDVSVYYIHGIKRESEAFLEQMKLAVQKSLLVIEELPVKREYDVIVDAIFGIGLKRMVKGEQAKAITWMNRLSGYKVAVDIPSGIHATTGEILGCAFQADLTVTFGYRKMGMVCYPGQEYAGRIVVEDIGFPQESLWHVKPEMVTFGAGDKALTNALKYYPVRKNRTNKGSFGHVLLIVGSKGMAGAAIIATKSAYRSGCGLVRVITHESNRMVLQMAVPEAVVLTYETLQQAYDRLDENYAWADAILIGSGLGRSDIAAALTRSVIVYTSKGKEKMPIVIDGDALWLVGQQPDILAKYRQIEKRKRSYLVLTPHLQEMSYLCKKSVGVISKKMLSTANAFIKNNNVKGDMTIVLKDARTIVTDGDFPAYINMTGNQGMATAGSGDCLAGMLVSLLAQRQKSTDAMPTDFSKQCEICVGKIEDKKVTASMAVCLHGCAGDEAARQKGTVSMTAMDMVEAISNVMKKYDE